MGSRDALPARGGRVAPSVRKADDARAHLVGHVHAHATAVDAAREHGLRTVGEAAPRGVVRVHVQHAAHPARDERGHVVHPRVVRAQVAPADEQQFVGVERLAQSRQQRVELVEERARADVDAPVAMEDPALDAFLESAEVDAVRRPPQLLHRKSLRPRHETVAVRAEPQQQVRGRGRVPAPAGAAPGAVERIERFHAERTAAEAQRELVQDLPVGAFVARARHDRRGPARDVAQRERRGDRVDVVLGQRPARRENHVGMARGLVDVDVDRHLELEPLERGLDAAAVRQREHRVAGVRDEGPHLPGAWCLDLLGEARGRQVAERLGKPAHAASPAGVPVHPPGVREHRGIDGRRREHRAAGPAESSRDDVEQVAGPRRQRAEAVVADADARVGDRPRRGEELACDPLDHREFDARVVGRRGRVEPTEARGDFVPVAQAIADVRRQARRVHHEFDEREQERGVAAGPDRHELVGVARGLGAARVDDDDLAAARADRADARLHVGTGHRAPLRHERVRADAQEPVRALDVRDGDHERVAVQVVRGGEARAGVLRPGAERVARRERLEEAVAHEQGAVVVRDGVAEIAGDGVGAVPSPDREETVGHEVEGLCPAHRFEVAGGRAPERRAHAVRVVVHGRHRDAFRADVAPGQDVVVVGPDGDDALRPRLAGHVEGEAARGLAQGAASKDGAGRGGGGLERVPVGFEVVGQPVQHARTSIRPGGLRQGPLRGRARGPLARGGPDRPPPRLRGRSRPPGGSVR